MTSERLKISRLVLACLLPAIQAQNCRANELAPTEPKGSVQRDPWKSAPLDLEIDAFNMELCGDAKFQEWQKEERAFGCEGASYESLMGALGENRNAELGDIRPRMAGARDAADGEFPFFAWLNCGGALIHNNLVVTAAHCVLDKKNVEVSLGSNRQDRRGLPTRQANKWCWPSKYYFCNATNVVPFYDLAVVCLVEPINCEPGVISPACLRLIELHTSKSVCAFPGLGMMNEDVEYPKTTNFSGDA